jgi:predicted transcriptional regulator
MIDELPRREREIFEIVCRLGQATAVEVRRAMSDPPTASAVRTLLSRLEARGALKHREEGQAYIYSPAVTAAKVRETALKQLVANFFQGSGVGAATALMGITKNASAEELDALQKAINRVRAGKS